jgi:hypothetical protein
MPADKDVLGKADALLRRHSIGTPGTQPIRTVSRC